jgi:hypothetical protein
MSEGLWCECRIPLVWQAAGDDALASLDAVREATLLMTALNNMEGLRELEQTGPEQRRLERIESKLDLSLYLLARVLGQNLAGPLRTVKLSPEEIEWQDDAPPPEGQRILVECRPSEALPLSVRLPAVALYTLPGFARARFEQVSEALADALYQFVFRCQRQAIRARLG